MSDLTQGDVVRLKSGGPTMTIDSIGDYYGETKAQCAWFEKSSRKTDAFALHSLEKVLPRSQGSMSITRA